MNRRVSLLAVSTLAAAITGFFSIGCNYCVASFEWQPSEPIDLGVDVDLLAIVRTAALEGDRYYEYVAVGEAGTIVAWGEVATGKEPELFVEVSQIGDADLRGIWSWWVVGDAGTIATSDNHGTTWNSVELPNVDADLHGITGFAGRPVIVGDEIVLVRLADGTWTQPPPPPGGWGSLRGVASGDGMIYAVGLAGKAWSTSNPLGEWTAESVGVDVDLFDVYMTGDSYVDAGHTVLVVGEAGTLLLDYGDGWQQRNTNLDTDLIDVHRFCVLAADGEVYDPNTIEPLDSVPGATAVECDGYGSATVGLDGVATAPPSDDC